MPVFSDPYTEGFESGVGGWTATAGITLTAGTPAITGTKSLVITRSSAIPNTGDGEEPARQGASITFTGMTPGDLYHFTMELDHSSAGNNRTIIFYVNGSDVWNTTTDVALTNVGFHFLATTSTVTIEAVVWAQGTGIPLSVGESFYIDTVQIDLVPSESYSFETPDQSIWFTLLDSFYSTAQAHTGTYSVGVTGTTDPGRTSYASRAVLSPKYPLAHGVTITASCWVYPVVGAVRLSYGDSYIGYEVTGDTSTGTGAWEQLTVTYDLNARNTGARTELAIIPTSPTDEILYYFDDVTFSWDTTDQGTGDYIAFDFESTLTSQFLPETLNVYPFDATGDAVFSLSTAPALGTTAAHVVTGSAVGAVSVWDSDRVEFYSGLYETVSTAMVKLSARVYVVSGGSTVTLGVARGRWHLDDYFPMPISAESTTTGAWEELTVYLTDSRDIGWAVGAIFPTDPSVVTEYYVDSIVMTPVAGLDIPIEMSADPVVAGVVATSGSLDIPLEITGTGYNIGVVPADGSLDIPIEITGTAVYTGPVLADGALDVPLEITGTGYVTGTVGADGGIDIPIEMSATPIVIHLASGEITIDLDILPAAASPLLTLPPAPLPAPPESAGVFPMPTAGGTTIRAVVGKTVTMDTPTITNGRPSS